MGFGVCVAEICCQHSCSGRLRSIASSMRTSSCRKRTGSPLGSVTREEGSVQVTHSSRPFAPQSPILPPANRNYRGWGLFGEGFLMQSIIGFAREFYYRALVHREESVI